MFKIEDIINQVHQADSIRFMRQMPDNSVDTIITDPPYGLFNPDDINQRGQKIVGAFDNIVFPYFNKRNIKPIEYGEFNRILIQSSDLRWLENKSIGIKSWVSVPEGAIDFNCDIKVRQIEIKTSGKSTSERVSDNELMDKSNIVKSEFVGDFILYFGDTIDFSACNILSGELGKFLSGSFYVPICAISSPNLPSFQGTEGSNTIRNKFVESIRLVNNPFSQSHSSPLILAEWRTKNGFMLRFDLTGGTAELLPADTTSQRDFSGQFLFPKLVRTFAGAGCLSSIFEPTTVSFVFTLANRTYSFYFHLWNR